MYVEFASATSSSCGTDRVILTLSIGRVWSPIPSSMTLLIFPRPTRNHFGAIA